MTHRCIHGEMTPTSITHGRCKIGAGKTHYANTCAFTYYFTKCPRFIENTNYQEEKEAERLEAIAAAEQADA